MDRDLEKNRINKEIIGLTYQETINYFNHMQYYFRPIQMDDIILWKDDDFDPSRCNIRFVDNKVDKIDGWY